MQSSSSSSLSNADAAICGATLLVAGATPSLASHLCEDTADTSGDMAAHREKMTSDASAAATVASVAVELLQLSGLPAAVSQAFPPAAWVLGSAFAATDLVGYLAGGVSGLVLLRLLRRAS